MSTAFAQKISPKPDLRVTLNTVDPGTINARVLWLSFSENEELCGGSKPFVASVQIMKILETGSGLVHVPNQGDTISVEVRGTKNPNVTPQSHGDYSLKENPCFTSDKSYYSIVPKK
ncbi:MAG: hypothetical protein AAGA66_00225 [Bacteroidota bacterium]